MQRRTVHKHRDLCAYAPERPHEGITVEYNDMIYAATRQDVEARRKASIRKWRAKHRAVPDSLEQAGEFSVNPSPGRNKQAICPWNLSATAFGLSP